MTDQAGLRRRMLRAASQIREQHERIVPLFAHLNAVIIEGSLRDAQTTAFRLQGALRTHFLLEEQIVFPVLRELCPDRSSEFVTLLEDHASLESNFGALIDHILAGAPRTATKSLRAFTSALLEHEKREEGLLQAVIGAES